MTENGLTGKFSLGVLGVLAVKAFQHALENDGTPPGHKGSQRITKDHKGSQRITKDHEGHEGHLAPIFVSRRRNDHRCLLAESHSPGECPSTRQAVIQEPLSDGSGMSGSSFVILRAAWCSFVISVVSRRSVVLRVLRALRGSVLKSSQFRRHPQTPSVTHTTDTTPGGPPSTARHFTVLTESG